MQLQQSDTRTNMKRTIVQRITVTKNYQDTYAIPIEPLPCESSWVIPPHILEEIILPPDVKQQPGRPPNKDRKKEFNEEKCKKSKVTCSNVLNQDIIRRHAPIVHLKIESFFLKKIIISFHFSY